MVSDDDGLSSRGHFFHHDGGVFGRLMIGKHKGQEGQQEIEDSGCGKGNQGEGDDGVIHGHQVDGAEIEDIGHTDEGEDRGEDEGMLLRAADDEGDEGD